MNIMKQQFLRTSRAVLVVALAATGAAAQAQDMAAATKGPVDLDRAAGRQVQFTRPQFTSPTGSVEVVTGAVDSLEIGVSKGRLVRLDRPAATVFVADPEIANIQVKSPSLVYLLGKAPGETTLFAVDARERVLANIDIRVTHDLGRMQEVFDRLHPDSGVQLASINGSVVLEGTVQSATEAEDMRSLVATFTGDDKKIINRLGISAPNQVNLRVRVAEISRSVDKQLGFNWNILGSIGGFSLGLTTANSFAAAVTQHTVSAARSFGKWDINAVIDALEQEGLVSVLAEPNLTALSGETASFLAGGEFPILVPDGNSNITIEFKKFGVSLAFTPTLLGTDRINMHVLPEVSQISTANGNAVSGETPRHLTNH